MIFFFTASCVSILGTDVTDIFRSFWHFVRNWTINLKKKMHSKKIINCIEKSICSRKRSQNDVKKCYLKRLLTLIFDHTFYHHHMIEQCYVSWRRKMHNGSVTTVNSLLVCTECGSHIPSVMALLHWFPVFGQKMIHSLCKSLHFKASYKWVFTIWRIRRSCCFPDFWRVLSFPSGGRFVSSRTGAEGSEGVPSGHAACGCVGGFLQDYGPGVDPS